MQQSRMDMNEVVAFVRIVEAGSLTAAARSLELPKSTLSRRLAALESRLATRLVHRTTRTLALTDAGQGYFDTARRVLRELDDAERAVAALQERPVGLLRVTAPMSFAFLGAIVAEYLEKAPGTRVELVCTDRLADLVEERFDVAIRAGNLKDSGLIVRNLGMSARVVVASPAWVAKHGKPRHPEALGKAAWLAFAAASPGRVELEKGGETVELEVEPRMIVNDFDLLEAAVQSGLGVALMPAFHCGRALADKSLVPLLPGWQSAPTPIHSVVPTKRHLTPKVRVFLEHVQRGMRKLPWLAPPR